MGRTLIAEGGKIPWQVNPNKRRKPTQRVRGGMIADGSGNPCLGKGHVPVEHIGVSSQSRRGLFFIYDFKSYLSSAIYAIAFCPSPAFRGRDLPLNFHPAATGVRLVFTPVGAG